MVQSEERQSAEIIAEKVSNRLVSHFLPGVTRQFAKNGFLNFEFTKSCLTEIYTELQPTKAETQEGYFMKPIGFLECCFREKFGTPRQSGLVKNARAHLTLTTEINHESLQGLEGFSHLYVIFIFHDGADGYNKSKAKIAPPKLEGQKMGVFATRTPHRFNPIGLSIAKLDRIDNRTLHLSGIDLIDGTPVIDIKPYHYVDALSPDVLRIPLWLAETKDKDIHEVTFSERATQDLAFLVSEQSLQFYRGPGALESVTTLIHDVLALNPHSVHTIAKHNSESPIWAVALDNLQAVYTVTDSKVQVIRILPRKATGDLKLRSKEWLAKVKELIN